VECSELDLCESEKQTYFLNQTSLQLWKIVQQSSMR
jgi:hypothetical protein